MAAIPEHRSSAAESDAPPRPRVIFVNRLFWPDPSATSQMLADLAEACAKRFEVHVIASGTGTEPADDGPAAITIHRVRMSQSGSGGLLRRAWHFLRFHLAASARLASLSQPGDVVVAMTDPPLLSVSLAIVARLRGARLVTWLHDLYPEVAIRLRVPFMAGVIGSALRRARDWSANVAETNVVIGTRMRDYMQARGITARKLAVVSNWADERAIMPVARDENPLRRDFGLGNAFVVGYSGTLGRAHDYATLLGAAKLLAAYDDIHFLFFGGGHSLARLATRVAAEGLASRFHFLPLQPREKLSLSLSLPDLHWVSLRPELEDCIVPSKIYGIAAAGRPMLAVGAPDGELGRLAEKYALCTLVEPGDTRGMADAILRYRDDPAALAAAGARVRALAESEFAMERARETWIALLEDAHAPVSATEARVRVG